MLVTDSFQKNHIPRSEAMSLGIFNVNNIEASRVTLSRGYHSYATQVVPTSHHAKIAGFKFQKI